MLNAAYLIIHVILPRLLSALSFSPFPLTTATVSYHIPHPIYKAATPANTPTAPKAQPASVARAPAPVLLPEAVALPEAALAVAEEEEVPELLAAPVPLDSVVSLALTDTVMAATLMPVLFWQSALYSAVVRAVDVKVMSAHCVMSQLALPCLSCSEARVQEGESNLTL